MLFIGICGASGSGKSTLADALKAKLGDRCYVINQDAYYRDHPQLSFEERSVLNYDEPEIFDHDLLLADMKTLIRGEPITRKAYDYSQHRRADTSELIYPHDVMILEGIHCFHDERLMELMYLKLYMNVEPDICLLRRIQRDIKERDREIDGISVRVSHNGEAHVRQVHSQLHQSRGRDRGSRRPQRPHCRHPRRLRSRRAE